MSWNRRTLQRDVLQEFIDAQRLKGTATTGRDDPRPRVELDPFAPAEDPLPPLQPPLRPMQAAPDDEAISYPEDRVVVVDIAQPPRPQARERDRGAPRYRPPRPKYRRRRPA